MTAHVQQSRMRTYASAYVSMRMRVCVCVCTYVTMKQYDTVPPKNNIMLNAVPTIKCGPANHLKSSSGSHDFKTLSPNHYSLLIHGTPGPTGGTVNT